MSGKGNECSGMFECELVYKLIAMEKMFSGQYIGESCPIHLEDFVLLNRKLKECFGRYVVEYSNEEVINLIVEYALLKKDL